MLCKRDSGDALLDALVKQGINLIVPPRDDLQPGDLVVGGVGQGVRRAAWGSVFGIEVDTTPKPENPFRSCSFGASDKLEVGAGATLLGEVLQAFGLGAGKASAALKAKGAHKLEFALVAPATRSLEDLDGILDLLEREGSAPNARYEGAAFFVITKVWRAKGLRLSVLDAAGAAITLDAKATEELTARGSISLKREEDGRYAYLADQPLVFGVNLRGIYSAEQGVVREMPVDHHLVFKSVVPTDPMDVLIGEDAFVHLVDDFAPDGVASRV